MFEFLLSKIKLKNFYKPFLQKKNHIFKKHKLKNKQIKNKKIKINKNKNKQK